MPDVPKIVHQRLHAVTPEQPHPEADVLTAFAEQALSASEREGVLRHLAFCDDCRDVIALALPAVENAARPVEEDEREVVIASAASGHARVEDKSSERRQPRFAWGGLAWSNLRWTALAAGIAMALLVVRPALERVGKTKAPANSAVSQPTPGTTTAGTLEVASGASSKDAPIVRNAEASAKTEVKGVESKENSTNVRPEFSSHKKAPAPPEMTMQFSAAGGAAKGANSARRGIIRRDSAPAAGTAFDLRARSAAAQEAAGKDALSKSASAQPTNGTTSEAVEVEAAASQPSAAPAVDSNQNAVARNEMPAFQNVPDIIKAKPALDGLAENPPDQDKAAQTALPSPAASGTSLAALEKQTTSWIIADGTLKSSNDGGKTWRPATRAEHPLLCFTTYGQEMWAGGQAGTLLHSTDQGTTWKTVAVSFNGQLLTSSVTRIDVPSPTQIVLTTDDHEAWSSTDGGKTWEKK